MSRPLRCALLVLLATLVAAPSAGAAPGDLDPTFGSGGQLRLLESHEESYAEAVAIQPDGKIVVAGHENGNAVVVRLLPDGAFDPSFGSGGKATLVVPTGYSEFRAVAIQPDGKIVAVGGAKGAVDSDFFFARFSAEGAPDPGFGGGDGFALVPVGSANDEAEAVAIGAGGKIVATGRVNPQGAGVVVVLANGTPDPGFGGGDGVVSKETPAGSDIGVAVVALADGSFIVGDVNAVGGGYGFVLLKLRPNGEYDSGFGGGDGIAITPFRVEGTELDAGFLSDIALLPDGRIAAAGTAFDYYGSPATYHSKVAAARYLPNGELDPSFGSGGIFSQRVENSAGSRAIELGEGGRYLLAGSYYNEALRRDAALVIRLAPDGTLDPAFGAGGIVARSDTAPFGEYVGDAAIDSEDRLLTIGTGYGGNNTSWASLTRYLGDPRPLPIAAPAINLPAHARMKAVPKKIRAGKLKGFRGSAGDPDGNGVRKVQIALYSRVKGAPRCLVLKNRKLRFKVVKRKAGKCPQRWIGVKGKAKWRFKFKGTLPPGKYVVFARAVDGTGLTETKFSRKLRNRYGFRVLPRR